MNERTLPLSRLWLTSLTTTPAAGCHRMPVKSSAASGRKRFAMAEVETQKALRALESVQAAIFAELDAVTVTVLEDDDDG